ncbi:MAG: hypothetical protein GTO40_26750 [Deltaproteobacteria bacterium]|nr:hypothetical protein [Deltaproteobacteria bacterium]
MELNDYSKRAWQNCLLKRTIVTTLASIALLLSLSVSAHFMGFRTVTFAWFANWLCLGWLFVIIRLVGRFQFSDGYHRLRPFERGGRLYRKLGVRGFLHFVRAFWRNKYLVYASSFPEQFETQTRQVEAHHGAVFLWLSALSGYAFLRGYYDAVAWLMLFNVPLNAYPILLQRYNRGRVCRVMARQRALEAAAPRIGEHEVTAGV